MRKNKTAILLTWILLICCSLTGCQTSEIKNTASEQAANAAAPEKKKDKSSQKKEDEYIDADYVDANYDEDEDSNFDKYKSGKKSKSSSKNSGSSQSGTNDNGGNDVPDQGSGTFDESAAEEQDMYHTDPVPDGRPEPVEPQDSSVNTDQALTCTLSVECSTILNNMDDLTAGKESLVPSNGVIFGPISVTFYSGESVYDVLLREMQNNRIHMEAEFTVANNSAYIKGINNLYERDCGNLSGWRYCVNGWYPNYGCSRYQVQNGDTIELHYTCDLGRDLDGDVPEGN